MGICANEQELIVQNNLPSRRWKTRRIRTGSDKKIRRMDKEHDKVIDQIYALGYEEINPPIQRGYKRLFVLTEDTKRNSKADFYQELLDKINTIRYSPDKVFKTKKRRTKKWRYIDVSEQKLKQPDPYRFFNNKEFTDEERQLFHAVENYNPHRKEFQTNYVFMEQWRFELRVKPHLITKIRVKDLVLEQYRDELEDYLDKYEIRSRLVKMWGGYTYSWKKVINKRHDRKKYSYNSLRNVPLHQITESYNEEKLWELN